MNHRNGVKKLGRDRAHRLAIINNLALSFFKYEKIKTTKLKAKLLKSFVEKIITRAKVDNLHNRRLVYRNIRDTKVIKKIFEDIGKRFQSRNGGYTRIYNIGQRKGDGAEICHIELTEELLLSTELVNGKKNDIDNEPKIEIQDNKNETIEKPLNKDSQKNKLDKDNPTLENKNSLKEEKK